MMENLTLFGQFLRIFLPKTNLLSITSNIFLSILILHVTISYIYNLLSILNRKSDKDLSFVIY